MAGLSTETQIQLLSWSFSFQGQVMWPQGCTFLWLYWSSALGQEGWNYWTNCCRFFPCNEHQCESVDVSPWGCNIFPLLWTLQMDYCGFCCYIFIYVSISSLHPQLGPGIFLFYIFCMISCKCGGSHASTVIRPLTLTTSLDCNLKGWIIFFFHLYLN